MSRCSNGDQTWDAGVRSRSQPCPSGAGRTTSDRGPANAADSRRDSSTVTWILARDRHQRARVDARRGGEGRERPPGREVLAVLVAAQRHHRRDAAGAGRADDRRRAAHRGSDHGDAVAPRRLSAATAAAASLPVPWTCFTGHADEP